MAAIIEIARKQNIQLPVTDYQTFCWYLMKNCPEDLHAYVAWECTPSSRTVCGHIHSNWRDIRSHLPLNSSDNVTVPLIHFIQSAYENRKGEMQSRLKAVKEDVNAFYLADFFESFLDNIMHHRNILKHFRSTHERFIDLFDSIYLDIDFSENLTIPVKHEPQSLHWHKEQVSVHSGILKHLGEKSYHPYFSDSKTHDQVFVNAVLKEMLNTVVQIDANDTIIIESDNCAAQYKSSEHFWDCQNLANQYNKKLIRIFGIAWHGKGEVDHVGGIAKVSIRQEIAAGEFFSDAGDMVKFSQGKYKDHTSPHYVIKEIDPKQLEVDRATLKLKNFRGIQGSSKFQVIIFMPNSNTIRAAPHLCICCQCQNEYGSCDLFQPHQLIIQDLNQVLLRSDIPKVSIPCKDDATRDFVVPGSVVAMLLTNL